MKRVSTFAALACMLALGAGFASRSLQAQSLQINGAGATFPNPIYSKWFDEYGKKNPNVRINYQPIGSGGGIRQITAQTVFFGATDGPMTEEQILAAPGKIWHLPTVLGADVPVYNLPGVSGEIKFTGAVLADIYSAKITRGTIRRSRSSTRGPSCRPPTSRWSTARTGRAPPTSSWTISRRRRRSGRSASAWPRR
jgi:phosphate transport system substrate-binding protein